MSKPSRKIEWVKTALIVILTVSALILLWQTRLLKDFIGEVPFFGNASGAAYGATPGDADNLIEKEAARPLTIVITEQNGERFGVKYDDETRNAAYDRTSSIFAEALGSMSELTVITEDEWRAALGGSGVFYEYAVPIRLSILDGWLRSRMPETEEDFLLRRVFVAFGEDRNRIFFSEHENALFYRAETASSAGMTQDIAAYNANGALFAFETELKAAENAPYTLIMEGNLHPLVNSESAGTAEELLEAAKNAFGHRGEPNILEYDMFDTLVCVGMEFEIRVFPGGSVIYRRTDDSSEAGARQSLSESEMIEAARVIIAETLGTVSGAEVYFTSIESESENQNDVTFSYYIAGGQVHMQEDGYAANITLSQGIVTSAQLNFRAFSVTEEYAALLPEIQAFAAANGAFALNYSDSGLAFMEPLWGAL